MREERQLLRTEPDDLRKYVTSYNAVREVGSDGFNIGSVEDMNVLIQNSLWLNVPVAKLDKHLQVKNLTGDKQKRSAAQLELIGKIKTQVGEVADEIIGHL